jgi:hypothetical protein
MHREIQLSRVAVCFAMTLLIAHPGASAMARDTVRSGTPTTGECQALPVMASTATPAMDVAVTSPAAETPAPIGKPADEATIERVVAAEYDLAQCLNAGDWTAAATLFSDRYRSSDLGDRSTTVEEFAAHLEEAITDPIELVAVQKVEVLPDGRIRDELIWYLGETLLHERDYWIEQDGNLVLDWIETLAIDGTPTATP